VLLLKPTEQPPCSKNLKELAFSIVTNIFTSEVIKKHFPVLWHLASYFMCLISFQLLVSCFIVLLEQMLGILYFVENIAHHASYCHFLYHAKEQSLRAL
jgi:hypothetical protein